MEITARIALMSPADEARGLLATADVAIDGLLVRGIKVCATVSGIRVNWPTVDRTDHCPSCDRRNTVRAGFCNWCGDRLDVRRAEGLDVYQDVCHPTDSETQGRVTRAVLRAFWDAWRQDRKAVVA